MKVSLFGYNRKETDNYFNYLNQNNSALTDEVDTLKSSVEELNRSVEDREKLLDMDKKEIETLRQQLEEAKAREADYQSRIEELQDNEAAYQGQIDALHRELSETAQNADSTDKLGIIFAVAYRDMENKNKAVSEKIKAYANIMFDRMRAYREEVAGIVDSVTEMQNKQREALINLCNDATKRLDALGEASGRTIQDMAAIEADQGAIIREIDAMVQQTIKTDEGSDRLEAGSVFGTHR